MKLQRNCAIDSKIVNGLKTKIDGVHERTFVVTFVEKKKRKNFDSHISTHCKSDRIQILKDPCETFDFEVFKCKITFKMDPMQMRSNEVFFWNSNFIPSKLKPLFFFYVKHFSVFVKFKCILHTQTDLFIAIVSFEVHIVV